MKKKKIWKWVELISFGLMLIGGINYLLMGLFGFDFFAAIFGGDTAVVSRIFYSLFGIAAAILLTVILWQAYMVKEKNNSNTSVSDSAKKSAPAKTTSSSGS